MNDFITKDSGERQQFNSGMVRDVQADKPAFHLILPKLVPFEEQMWTRVGKLLARGAKKYSERNWEQANSQEELDRFISSELRHSMQWACGERDEDHGAAVIFNIIGGEYVRGKLENKW